MKTFVIIRTLDETGELECVYTVSSNTYYGALMEYDRKIGHMHLDDHMCHKYTIINVKNNRKEVYYGL